jgi:hypothetical protein
MDGLKLYLQQSEKSDVQEQFYNGWTHNHYVASVFVFCPDGTIPIAFFNVPGAVHNNQIVHWGKIYDKLDGVYKETGEKCTVDSAFAKVNHPFLLKSSQDILLSSVTLEQREEIQRKIQATLMRQAVEWGMRSLRSLFPRLKDRFVYEEGGEQQIVLKTDVLMYNLYVHLVKINQIRNVYISHLNIDANQEMNIT